MEAHGSSMSVTPADLADHIRHARKEKGWTLKECADRAGIGKTAMFDLEHGNPGVRLNTLLAVLDQLGLSLHLDDESTTPPPVPAKQREDGSSAPQVQDLPDHLL
jgi:transcriptional regulator with XRE-family HTH domain